MDTRRIAIYAGRVRVGMGLAMLAAPRATLRPLLGQGTASPVARTLARFAAGRDVVLGAGVAIAAAERNGGGSWLSMAAVADGVDALACLATPDLPRAARVLGVAAAGSAVAQLLLARRLATEELASA